MLTVYKFSLAIGEKKLFPKYPATKNSTGNVFAVYPTVSGLVLFNLCQRLMGIFTSLIN